MRNLTITRTKSFVASLGKMKVYIEDPDSSELLINGVPCRKLGDLKNGETRTFPIGEQAAKVFVIGDQLSRNYSNDYYPLPAGTEDITVTGKNAYNPGAGNPFRFDGVTDPEVLANRKKGGKKGTLVLIFAVIIGFLMGLAPTILNVATSNGPKEFSGSGMTITLTKAFEEVEYQGFTQCYESREAVVFMLKEEFSLVPGLEDYTLEDYADLVLSSNSIDAEVKTENGVMYFTYTSAPDGTTFYYMATLHKSSDAFWLIQFATPESMKDEYHSLFLEWAASVEFE